MSYRLVEILMPTVGKSRHAIDLVFESIPTVENRHVGRESVRLKDEFSPLSAQEAQNALKHLRRNHVWEEIPRVELTSLRSIAVIVSVLETQRWKPPSIMLM